jgi:3'-5' exoribonuclease
MQEGGRPGLPKVKDLKEGQDVRGFFAVRSKELPRDYKNKVGMYFFLTLGDSTGEMNLKYWGGEDSERTMKVYNSFQVGSVVYIQAVVGYDKYDDCLAMVVNEGVGEIKLVEEGVEGLDLVPALESDRIQTLTEELFEIIASVSDVSLKMLLQSFFSEKDFLEAFKYSPSAIKYHHAYIGGNLEHTINVARIVDLLATRYTQMDRDLAITGALLHDVGKLKEYKVTASVDMTSEGAFLGHSQLGWEMIRQHLEKVPGFPDEKRLRLWDIIIHHHGTYTDSGEVAAANLHTIESCALHYADNADSKVGGFSQYLRRAAGGKDDWVYIKEFGFSIYTR